MLLGLMSLRPVKGYILTATKGIEDKLNSLIDIFIMFRPDVVLDRGRFISEFETYQKEAVKIDPNTLDLVDLDKPYLMINQDEKIHHRFIIFKFCIKLTHSFLFVQ